MRNVLLLCMSIVVLIGTTACKKASFDIAKDDYKKSLPDIAYNSTNNNSFVFWAAAPAADSNNKTYFISGRKLSGAGMPLGRPVTILETNYVAAMPRVLYNPNKNQFLVIYGLWESSMNIRGVILDANGKAVGEHFKVTDVPANQFHYTMAFDPVKNQYFITYNDSRNGCGDIFGIILSDAGAVVKKEFVISSAVGHQVNPVVCYNPQDKTYLVNWEDFRQHGESLDAYGTLDVMTNIQGALLDDNGTILVNDIPMCVDDAGDNADQRFNGIAYNSDKNEFLVTWTDTRDSLQNIGIKGRIVAADGSMPAGDFTVVDSAGAQMISHAVYVPEQQKYFIAFERDLNDVDDFYFKDITAKLDIGAQWLDANGQPEGSLIDIYGGDGNQRFVRFAHNTKADSFALAWQDDFPGVSDSVNGHIMSAGGNIMGAVFKE